MSAHIRQNQILNEAHENETFHVHVFEQIERYSSKLKAFLYFVKYNHFRISCAGNVNRFGLVE